MLYVAAFLRNKSNNSDAKLLARTKTACMRETRKIKNMGATAMLFKLPATESFTG